MSQITDVVRDCEEAQKPDGRTPKDLLEVLAGTTACSSAVFYGLLAWASLNAPLASKAGITTVLGRQGSGPYARSPAPPAA